MALHITPHLKVGGRRSHQMKQNVEHLKTAKDNEEKEPQVSSTLIDSGPRNEHTLLIAPYNLELYCYRIDCHNVNYM